MIRYLFPSIVISGLLFTACNTATNHSPDNSKPAGAAVNVQADSILFAVIGDYGADNPQEDSVANMVKSWNPDFIITVGDNNYPDGSASTIKNNIGKYYGDYIYNPDAPAEWQCTGRAAQQKQNRFFPATGNEDQSNNLPMPLKPYLDYFTLPGDETNYDFSWGPIHFYSINSGPDGNIPVTSTTANWLHQALQKDTQTFKIVYFHHPPYSSGSHGSSVAMRWPFHNWGVDAVLSGHEHFYGKAISKTTPAPLYIICGSSGKNQHYNCNENPLDTTQFNWFCDNVHFGAIKVKVTPHKAIFEYYAVEDLAHPVDVNVINK